MLEIIEIFNEGQKIGKFATGPNKEFTAFVLKELSEEDYSLEMVDSIPVDNITLVWDNWRRWIDRVDKEEDHKENSLREDIYKHMLPYGKEGVFSGVAKHYVLKVKKAKNLIKAAIKMAEENGFSQEIEYKYGFNFKFIINCSDELVCNITLTKAWLSDNTEGIYKDQYISICVGSSEMIPSNQITSNPAVSRFYCALSYVKKCRFVFHEDGIPTSLIDNGILKKMSWIN